MKFYKCYSLNLHRFLKANSQKPLSKGVNETTHKTFWVYPITQRVSDLLGIWSAHYEQSDEE